MPEKSPKRKSMLSVPSDSEYQQTVTDSDYQPTISENPPDSEWRSAADMSEFNHEDQSDMNTIFGSQNVHSH